MPQRQENQQTCPPQSGTSGAQSSPEIHTQSGASMGGTMSDGQSTANRPGDAGDRASAADEMKGAAAEAQAHAGQWAQQAQEAAKDVRHTATEAASRFREQGTAAVSQQKTAAAEELLHISAALRSAAGKLHDEQDHRVADWIETAAQRVDGVASYVLKADVGQLLGDVDRFARRRPEVFFGGLFVLGLMGSRFLRASHPRSEHRPLEPHVERVRG